MKSRFSFQVALPRALSWAVLAAGLLTSQVWAQPSNRPLLTGQTGARPNLMIALDNSGSMAYSYHETYFIRDSNENGARRICPAPFSNIANSTLSVFNAGVGGDALFRNPGYRCYQRQFDGTIVIQDNVSVAAGGANGTAFNWSAQRSSDVNPVYYNPTVRYLPRVDGSGAPVAPVDNTVWVSNQTSVPFRYTVYQRNVAPFDYRIYHSMFDGGGTTRNFQGVINTLDPAGFTARYTPVDSAFDTTADMIIPQHRTWTAAQAPAAPAFTYARCTNIIRDGAGQEISCTARTLVNVVFGAAATYAIPTPNNRTDCTNNTCTNAQEVANIMNWYRWYSNRQQATSTAIGLALTDTDSNGAPINPSTLDGQVRIGYMPINDTTIPNGGLGGNTNLAIQNTPGSAASNPAVSRGVRSLRRGTADNTQLFNWLYGILSRGATPLHNSVIQAGNYFQVRDRLGATLPENPWRTVPTNTASPEMTCRRSFNLLFSDGGWTNTAGGANVAPNPAGRDFDDEPQDLPVITRAIPAAPNESFERYLPDGINTTPEGRIAYTPYGSPSRGGLADLTAQYFWHTDMRPSLANGVLTRPGQPTYWQNMATYTVGYQVKPSGSSLPGGLTFAQISQYQTNYTKGEAFVFPGFPTGDLLSDLTTTPQRRVDDFVHAGYTGGARSFSATTAEEVKSIFKIILADILSASGLDAGVSVSSAGGDATTLTDELKYTVSYNTLNNAGDIVARELDDDGDETNDVAWRATDQLPSYIARRVFTMHDLNQPRPFSGPFTSLETDIQDALKLNQPDGDRIRNDASFINYLRGDNGALDTAGNLFRQRTSLIGAMVNPPSMYMGGDQDYAYDLQDAGGVEGRGSYEEFANRKRGYTSSLFVATNAGTMHSLNSATGVEQSAFMPRRSLKRMLNFAKEPYNFEYVLDGPISPNDIFDRRLEGGLSDTEKWRAWRQIGVGSGGRGEPLIYAVGSPFNRGSGAVPANRGPNEEDILWETGPDIVNLADGEDVSMGYISNSARSGQTEDLSNNEAQRGEWIVAINNGHYNGQPNGAEAGLIVLKALTGEVIRTIPLPSTYSAGRGLSGVTLVRSYGFNGRVTHAYAGDANGNLWRFNLTGEPRTWHVEYGRPIFTTPGNRPIYGHPAWQKHGNGGYIVVFASGIMLQDSDLDDMRQQRIFAIWDRRDEFGTDVGGTPWAPVTDSELQEQAVLLPNSVLVPGSDPNPNDSRWYQITNNPINWQTQRGWFMNLGWRDAGERNIADVRNVGTSVLITTTVLRRPDDVEMCTASSLPVNYMYVLNAQTGSQNLSRSFDVDGDNRQDQYAVLRLAEGGYSRGVSVTSYYSRSDGSPLVEDGTDNHVSDPLDPTVPRSQDIRRREQAAEEHGESYSEKNGPGGCRNIRGVALGTVAESVSFGVGCPTTAWSRTQFQLSEPPKN